MSTYIPLNKLGEGIQESIDNASRYLQDAVFLHQNKRYQSSILLSMLSYEEAGKALLLMDYEKKKKLVTRRRWKRKFCSHKRKNLVSIRAIWQDAGYVSRIPDSDVWQARFDVDWKNVFTYTDYDFENLKWTSPMISKTFGIRDVEQFSHNAISHAADALKCIIRRVREFQSQVE